MVIYSGPSRIDPSTEIIGIVTGLKVRSANPKTGTMAQLWILVRDQSPLAAIDQGRDHAICGDCKLRGTPKVAMGGVIYQDRSCYVMVKNAPLSVWRKYQRGGYETRTPAEANQVLRDRRLSVRLGAYGDPAALPIEILQALVEGVKFTGYTHQWAQCDSAYQTLLMASVDSPKERLSAGGEGWRTFRVRTEKEPISAGEEISCPASAEMGHRSTCDRCTLCAGTSKQARSIAILAHGTFKARLIRMREEEVR